MLTKSKFKIGSQCPTKLYYRSHAEYANQAADDSFLAMLAAGGFQVGELARHYFPGGTAIDTPNDATAVRLTAEYLTLDEVTLFEAAFQIENCFVRADVLVKRGNVLELIEVKAKSFDVGKDEFLNKDGSVSSRWIEVVEDIAFQKYVIAKASSDFEVRAYLMLADKSKKCPTDGLHQKLKVEKRGTRPFVSVVGELLAEDLDPQILIRIPADDACSVVTDAAFTERIAALSEADRNDRRIAPSITSVCGKCEFRNNDATAAAGKKSGFEECWTEALGWTAEECTQPTVLDVWRLLRKDDLLAQGVIRMAEIERWHIPKSTGEKPGMSRSERQWLQVSKHRHRDNTPHFEVNALRDELASWTFPLHFIDFETAAPAVPINRGLRPYEIVAFQFSHHAVDSDGTVRHADEYLNVEAGRFPNFEFVRRLKSVLENDQGSVFRYAAHENTVLAQIYEQLKNSGRDLPDRGELMEFVRTLTNSTRSSSESWHGTRSMIDMLDIVQRCFYHPRMGGSNSIKYVLPAMIESSRFLQDRYSRPIYGSEIESLNYRSHAWIARGTDGRLVDPYKQLPPLFDDIDPAEIEAVDIDEIREGGAAMVAYYRLQHEDLPDAVRAAIIAGLRKYCELDTFAMVMIYEGWREVVAD